MNEDREPLGFKRLTPANWLEPVDWIHIFSRVSSKTGVVEPMTGEDWAQGILAPTLDEQVPVEIERLFEVARGTMLYGYFFYPMYTLGVEQLSRVLEAAVTRIYNDLGGPEGKTNAKGKKEWKTYKQKLDWLVEKEVIPKKPATELKKWTALRQLRNYVSHAPNQSLTTPGCAVIFVHCFSSHINFLFTKERSLNYLEECALTWLDYKGILDVVSNMHKHGQTEVEWEE